MNHLTDSVDIELMHALQQKMEWELRYQRCAKEAFSSSSCPAIPNADPFLSLFLKTAWDFITTEAGWICATAKPILAYAGGIGAYGEQAALHMLPHVHIVSAPLFEDVFEGVSSGIYDYGIVPIENSTGGMIDTVTHLMWKHPFHIVGAVVLPVWHALLGIPGAREENIDHVLSHPQALRQCRRFLQKKRCRLSPVSSTATAARWVAKKKDPHTAAIGSKHAADVYGLSVLKEKITDRCGSNYTRFIVISKEKTHSFEKVFDNGRRMCSVAFMISDTPGSLYSVLKAAVAENISFTRLDSVELSPGKYFFMADFPGEETSPSVERFLMWLKKNTSSYIYLGNYREILADIK